MNRFLIFCTLFAIPLLMFGFSKTVELDSTSYNRAKFVFKAGTRWEHVDSKANLYTYTLTNDGEIAGEKCMKLWHYSNSDPENTKEFCVYMRVDKKEDKVWFIDEEDSTEWLLLYDFGMQIGEQTTVYLPNSWNSDSKRRISYNLIFTDAYWNIGSDLRATMMFSDVNSVSDNELYPSDAAYWIYPIGSVWGLLTPTMSPDFGEGIYRVICDNNVIYEDYAKTHWINQYLSLNSAEQSEAEVTVCGRMLTVANAHPGSDLLVTNVYGNVIKTGKIGLESMNMEMPETGIYLVTVAGKTVKVAVR